MSHPSKIKGNKFERDCCKKAEEYEIPSKRAWGSDGDKEYNDETHIQCKIRKRLPDYIFPKDDAIDCQLIRQDRGESYIVIRYDDYLAEMRRYRTLKQELELYEGSSKSRQK